ncbi:Protein kinase, catalytic domain-containing protein [Artemisia annua]|uniref:Protein kinase, catalytic domain-containing protein n=1 Tax=Artemisia annua TaxID=35608 RepID=A0A2U1P7F8_ARTAN|nr:Protein kinase, catalytic domain-containing protein [Artemisia annua]
MKYGGGDVLLRVSLRERRRSKPNPRLSNLPKNIHGEQVVVGWPAWPSAIACEAIIVTPSK